MRAVKLQLQQFRNFAALEVALHPQVTLVSGANGSGKTSLLEALYYLIYGRSFRTHLISRILKHAATGFTITAHFKSSLRSMVLGLERNLAGYKTVKFDGELLTSHTSLIQKFPLQLFDHESYMVLAGGSRYRRELLDRGLFHVKPEFLEIWRRYMKVLQHRNSALREHARHDYIQMWDQELIACGEQLTELRSSYLTSLTPVVNEVLKSLSFPYVIELKYLPGWSAEETLAAALDSHFKEDLNRGYTTAGPHHADLAIKADGNMAKDFLSRGQQKILIYALLIAETRLLYQQTGNETLLLVDDLLAELDQNWAKRFVALALQQPQLQLIFTTTTTTLLQSWLPKEHQLVILGDAGQS